LIVGIELQRQRDSIRLRVFDRVEEQLSNRLKEQRADILPGIRARISAISQQVAFILCPVRQPGEGGGSPNAGVNGKQLYVQRPRDGHRFVELLLPRQQLVRAAQRSPVSAAARFRPR
jgi:hypothetical protein